MNTLGNPQDTEKAILQSLFESVEKSPNRETQIIRNGLELKPGDEIVKTNGDHIIIQALKKAESGQEFPHVKVFSNWIVRCECISNKPPSAKFFPYKSKRLVLKKEISPYRLIHELAREVESFKRTLKINDSMVRPTKMEEISLSLKGLQGPKRRHKSAIEKMLEDKKAWYGLNQARKELDKSLKDFLLASAKEITPKTISDRMLWFYVARILVATGIETDTVDKVVSNLQAKYRYQKKEKYPFDLAYHCHV